MVTAPGYQTLTTHVFDEDDQYLDTDAVFGVRSSLLANFERHEGGSAPDGAQVVWLVFVVAAVFLAVGALCIALDFNRNNPLVEFFINGANVFDLGIFSRKDGLKSFDGSNASVKNALFNWGLGAIAYLIVGRIVVKIIQP